MRLIGVQILILAWLFSACSKKSGNEQPPDTIPPVIALNTPTDGQVFAGDILVSVTGTITDNTEIAEIHVHVYNQANNQLIADIHQNPHTASYALNESFMALKGITYIIQVIAIDKAINQQMKTVTIHVT